MAAPASPAFDDPEMLKALLAEERAENERLRQIILAMQRHRFGRRAESLPEDQLLLGLEEAEQVEAAGFAAEESEPAKKEARRVSGARIVGRCPPTCRGSSASSISTAPPVHAARVPCIGSARMYPSASTWCRRSSGCW
ncbi:hypothetical protein MRA01_53180 [Methylobacterium radiotolerans]|nr:hypothetical protein MRA01_53180 [Methylobacterium radiotolerans]